MTGYTNLFDPDTATVGKKLDDDGNVVDDPDYTLSGQMQADNLTALTTNIYDAKFACYDANNALLGISTYNPHTAPVWQELRYDLPGNTSYVIGSFPTNNKNTIWVGNFDGALMPDRVHPSSAGQKNIASIAYMKIKEVSGF